MPPIRFVQSYLQADFKEPSTWWKDGSIAGALAEALERNGLWLDFAFTGRTGAKSLERIAGPGELAAFAASWDAKGYVLQREAKESPRGTSLELIIRKATFGLRFAIGEPALEPRRESLLRQWTSFAIDVWRLLDQRARLATATVYLLEPYPRVRPPPETSSPFRPGSLADVYDLDYVRAFWPAQDVTAIAGAALPPGAQRRREGELVAIEWASALDDLETVNRARSAQERWMVGHLSLPTDSDYNAAGDLREPSQTLVEHPPLTFYDPRIRLGYKTLASADDEDWQEVAAWARAHALPDGSPLDRLRLIVPTRALALSLQERAAAAGIEAVLYPDDDGNFWNPAPKGPWSDDSG